MTSTPLWFGPTERPLFGFLHLPDDGRVRGVVVVCPPLGREDIYAHSTLRELAGRLEAEHIAVLRFDYDGTGDSAGDQDDPDRVAAWTASTRAAVELARAGAGPAPVGAVGMRVGATLASYEAVRHPLDVLVLWDPCTGRAYLREQAALHALSLGRPGPGDGSVQTPGFRYDADTTRELGRLRISSTQGPLAEKICLVTRPERGLDATLEARLGGAGELHYEVASGLDELLDADGQLIAVPSETVRRLAAWVSSALPDTTYAFERAPFDRLDTAAVVSRDPKRGAVVERPVRVGRAELFAIVTEGRAGAPTATVLCLNMGRSRRIGPSRMWVELARSWAGDGVRTVRMDLSGLGDSGTRPGQSRDVMYPDEAAEDIEAMAGAVSPDDPSRVVLVGVSSGAFHAIRSGAALGALGTFLVNPPPLPGPADTRQGYTTPRRRRLPSLPLRRWALKLAGGRAAQVMVKHMPEPAWWVVNRFGLRYSLGAELGRLLQAGPDVLLVASGDEVQRMRKGADRALRRFSRSGRFRFEVLDGLDHSLLGAEDRTRVSGVLFAYVRDLADAGTDAEPTPGPPAPAGRAVAAPAGDPSPPRPDPVLTPGSAPVVATGADHRH